MNHNFEKILYLGASVLLVVMALTAFFANYAAYQAYFSNQKEVTETDHILELNKEQAGEFNCDALLFKVLQTKKQDEALSLSLIYQRSTTSAAVMAPALYINGTSGSSVDLRIFQNAAVFREAYDIDPQGVITAVRYTAPQ